MFLLNIPGLNVYKSIHGIFNEYEYVFFYFIVIPCSTRFIIFYMYVKVLNINFTTLGYNYISYIICFYFLEIYYVNNRYGNRTLVFLDQRFNKSHEREGRTSWRCVKRNSGCRAVVVTYLNSIIQFTEHNHAVISKQKLKLEKIKKKQALLAENH